MTEPGRHVYEVQGRKWRNWAVLLKLNSPVQAHNAYQWYTNKSRRNEGVYVDVRLVQIIRTTEGKQL